MIDEVLRESRENGTDILLVHVKAPVRDVLQRSGITDKLGEGHIYDNFDDALASLNNKAKNAEASVEAMPVAGISASPQ
jgi:hypothetical protein